MYFWGSMERRQGTKKYYMIILASFPKAPNTYYSVRKPWRFRLPHCHLTPLSREPLATIRINLILPETRFTGLHLRCWQYASVFIQIFVAAGSERRTCFETEYEMALQGHPRSLILSPIESTYATLYWSSIATLVLSCPVSEILQVFAGKTDPTPIPPLDYISDVVGPRCEDPNCRCN